MPLYRRLPKRCFTNPFKITYLAVNLSALEKVSGDEITPATLFAAGILKNVAEPVKLLGHGDVARALVVRDIPVSASAKAKIEAAGGRVEA
jgi:large subunit ribosomal protein L15